MQDPQKYENAKPVPDVANLVFVPKLIEHMKWDFRNGCILDYGCGSGSTGYNFILPQVKTTNSMMYSADVSAQMVKFAEKEFAHSKIKYSVGEIPHNFPFFDMLFDKIFAVHVLHFVNDIKTMLANFREVLKPQGQIGFTCTTTNCDMIKIWEVLANTEKWRPFMHNYKTYWPEWTTYGTHEPNQYFRDVLFNDTGFCEEYFEFVKFPVTMDADIVLDLLMSVNPCLNEIPNELLSDLKADYANYFFKVCGNLDDASKLSVPVEYLCVVLQKTESET